MKPTEINEFMNNLNAGLFSAQVAQALSDVAAGVVEHGKKGKVVLSFEISQIAQSHQVKINHKLDFVQPTKRGQKREDSALDTPMHVTADGLVLFLSNPTRQLFSRDDAPVTARAV
ncbi:MAG: hypothetical protein RBR82_15885 [Pseudomonas sp.]|nr:hypothetical protein [Pseudomonas sp.]